MVSRIGLGQGMSLVRDAVAVTNALGIEYRCEGFGECELPRDDMG